MTEQTLLYILGILGVGLMVVMSINAFFIKSLLDSLHQVKTQTAILIDRSEAKEKRIVHIEEQVEQLKERYHKIARSS